MNNKKLLTTVGVLFASAIAATSGTLAWFTAVRNASIQYGNATITTESSDLDISFKSSLNNLTTAPVKEGSVITFAYNHVVTDISGDGLTLYKPVWFNQEDSHTGEVSEILTIPTTTVGDADGYFVDFTLTVSRGAGLNGFKVYLGSGTKIKPDVADDAEDIGIVSATRMAVINDGEVVIRYAQVEETEEDPHYIYADALETAYGKPGFGFQEDEDLRFDAFVTSETQAGTNYPPIADLTSYEDPEDGTIQITSADVTFRFWVEGEDQDAVNDYLGGVFSIVLDIYALEA